MKNKLNFPEELQYENIVKSMGDRKNFIPDRGSIFPHASINNVDFNAHLPAQNTSNEDLEKYLAKLPKTFDEWTK